jgi:DNA-binding NarL/FixJ family response regulator
MNARESSGRSDSATADPRVLLAAHRPAERGGLRLALAGNGFEVCGEADNAVTAIALAGETQADVCVIALDLPGSGIAAAARICSDVPRTAVVMLANELHEDDLFDALRAGAMGFLTASMDPARLPHALRGVLRGEAALPRKFVGRLVDELRDRGRRRVAVGTRDSVELTSREWQVLELLQQRLSTKQIALRLGITQVTVRRHVGSILQKLDVQTRAEAIALLGETAV